jgi:hypothetical protein
MFCVVALVLGVLQVWDGCHNLNSDGLVANWKFDDANETITHDVSGCGHTGTLFNGPALTMGLIGNALYFDGRDDYVAIFHTPALDVGNTLSVAAWVKPASSARQTIVGQFDSSGRWQLELTNEAANKICISAREALVACIGKAATVGAWNHIVYTRTGPGTGVHKFYLNGISYSLTTDLSPDYIDSSIKELGRAKPGLQQFHGHMDDVRIYNRALSAGEVRALYNLDGQPFSGFVPIAGNP